MAEFERNVLLRTKRNLLENLDRINDAVESSTMPIQDHMVLDDVKDSLKGLKYIRETLGDVKAETVKAVVKTAPAPSSPVA